MTIVKKVSYVFRCDARTDDDTRCQGMTSEIASSVSGGVVEARKAAKLLGWTFTNVRTRAWHGSGTRSWCPAHPRGLAKS